LSYKIDLFMKKIFFLLTLFVVVIQFKGNAQKTIVITKNEVLNTVSKNNLTLKISEQELNQAKAEFNQTKGVFLPNIAISHTGISTTNPLMAFGSKLNQGILTANDFDPAILNNPAAIQNFASKINIEQSIINLEGFYQHKALKTKLNAIGFKTKRTKEYLLFEAEKAFYQLQLAYKTVKVLKTIEKAILENKRLINGYYKQGLLQKTAVLEIEIRVLEIKNQLQFSKSNLENASNYLSFFMNDKKGVILKPSEDLELMSLNINSQNISENRADLQALKETSTSYKIAYKAQKSTFLPTLNAFGNYEVNSNKVLNTGTSGYLVGFQLNWNLFQGLKRVGSVQKSKAQYHKSEIEYDTYLSKSKLEYQKSKRNFIDVQNKLVLSKKAVNQSKEALRIKNNRFKQGLEKTADLLQSEALYAQKLLMYYQTVFEFNTSKSYLEFLIKE